MVVRHGCERVSVRRIKKAQHVTHALKRVSSSPGASRRMLRLLTAQPPPGLQVRVEIRDLLRFLQGRHYSAGWFLLLTSVCAGALRAAGDPCEAYSVLIHAAATLSEWKHAAKWPVSFSSKAGISRSQTSVAKAQRAAKGQP